MNRAQSPQALFTISFQLFVGFVLTNIVMAVLLEKFTEDAEESKVTTCILPQFAIDVCLRASWLFQMNFSNFCVDVSYL